MLEPLQNSMQLNLLDTKIEELNRTIKLTMQTMSESYICVYVILKLNLFL